jgi:ABC-2 type transport system permease protein
MTNFSIENILALLGALVIITVAIAVLSSIPALKSLWPGFNKYRPLLFSLVSRDIKVKYRRSVLGIVWSVLNPLFMMLVISAVFMYAFRIEVENYPAYYITGILIFNFMSEATSLSLGSILGSAGLINKVYIPKYIFPLQKCLFAFVNMLFSLIAVAIVYLILGMEIHPTVLLFFVPMIYTLIFGFGLSLILSSSVVFLRDIHHLYAILVMAWMYLTPILYPLTILPDFMQVLLKFNPMVYYVEYARNVMMYNTIPDLGQNLICIGFALLTLCIGLIVFKRTQDKFVLHM